MVKKRAKRTRKKKTSVKKAEAPEKSVNEILIENFVSLQKVLTNLSIKFEGLSDQMSKLLQLFEISARSFGEKHTIEKEHKEPKDEEFLNKLDTLLDQNKTIARGLTLMEERLREKQYNRF